MSREAIALLSLAVSREIFYSLLSTIDCSSSLSDLSVILPIGAIRISPLRPLLEFRTTSVPLSAQAPKRWSGDRELGLFISISFACMLSVLLLSYATISASPSPFQLGVSPIFSSFQAQLLADLLSSFNNGRILVSVWRV
ncbi:hypothetical protein SAY87_026880 [Trapa incisa]|uniref:Uncharacterized protein n=1 Tax=Trapa incisa TaxID=236973 RepID=A0AAN7GQX1_9MYRT|nr:hypothetical protein SAY87_026880 [Trapa incisa]